MEIRTERLEQSRIMRTVHPTEVRMIRQELEAYNGHGLVYPRVTVFDSYAVLGHMDEMTSIRRRAEDCYW